MTNMKSMLQLPKLSKKLFLRKIIPLMHFSRGFSLAKCTFFSHVMHNLQLVPNFATLSYSILDIMCKINDPFLKVATKYYAALCLQNVPTNLL